MTRDQAHAILDAALEVNEDDNNFEIVVQFDMTHYGEHDASISVFSPRDPLAKRSIIESLTSYSVDSVTPEQMVQGIMKYKKGAKP